MTKANPEHSNAVKRASKRKELAWKWIKLHRPDVSDAIQAEAEKMYPYRLIPRRPERPLPESLRKMK